MRSIASITEGHYASHTATSYEANLFYSTESPFTQFLRDEVQSTLNLNTGTNRNICLLDVGGGTGNFTRMVLEEAGKNRRVGIVLDPFLEASKEVLSSSSNQNCLSIQFITEDAQIFIDKNNRLKYQWMQDFNMCLMKEVVHHFDAKNRRKIFRGIHRELAQNISDETTPSKSIDLRTPNLLVVTRPKWDIDYPFYDWEKVREVWANNQPSVEEIEDDLHIAGFQNVKNRIVPFKCSTSVDGWTNMIKNRLWSTFSYFTDDELSAACDLIQKSYANTVSNKNSTSSDDGIIEFEERMVFITAQHSSSNIETNSKV